MQLSKYKVFFKLNPSDFHPRNLVNLKALTLKTEYRNDSTFKCAFGYF